MSLILSGTDGLSDVDGTAATPAVRGTDTNTGLFFPAADTVAASTGGTERLRLDSSGNLGLGGTPSAWISSGKAIDIGGFGSVAQTSSGSLASTFNAYQNSAANWIYKTTNAAAQYQCGLAGLGQHAWFVAPSGTAGNAISFTQAMTLDASGNLGVGSATASGSGLLSIAVGNTTGGAVAAVDTNGARLEMQAAGAFTYLFATTNDPLLIGTNNTERARITSGGDLLVGVTAGTGSWHHITKGSGQGQEILSVIGSQAGSQAGTVFFGANTITANTAATVIRAERNSSTSRSINAGGTINASGADYAEYMTKAGDFTIAKGDVCGIDANGKLTNVFADAVSFCVKSTDPSYVGGDSWGAGFEDDAEGLEAARQKVDRIAFAGQVPVNVMGATPGQYIVPVNDNGAIKGIPKNEADMTLAEYMKAVGKVIATQADGRAFIIVKVA